MDPALTLDVFRRQLDELDVDDDARICIYVDRNGLRLVAEDAAVSRTIFRCPNAVQARTPPHRPHRPARRPLRRLPIADDLDEA